MSLDGLDLKREIYEVGYVLLVKPPRRNRPSFWRSCPSRLVE